jgi:redox-sensitive bicupin YhaK (pirin superfamily)
MRIITRSNQAYGAFNNGQIIENKPIGFPQDKGFVRPFGSLFYWARAEAVIDSTIGLHPHQGFEIMSFVLEGRIRHFDTKLNHWKPLEAGDVQIIRSGNGISHSEHLEKGAKIFQIWLDPDLSRTLQQEVTYDDYAGSAFEEEILGELRLIHYAGQHGRMVLDTPGVDIRRIRLAAGTHAWAGESGVVRALYAIDGSGTFNGSTVERDDFIIAEPGESIEMMPHRDGLDVFAISMPFRPAYSTYAERMRISG